MNMQVIVAVLARRRRPSIRVVPDHGLAGSWHAVDGLLAVRRAVVATNLRVSVRRGLKRYAGARSRKAGRCSRNAIGANARASVESQCGWLCISATWPHFRKWRPCPLAGLSRVWKGSTANAEHKPVAPPCRAPA
jgi:hypothetical protein